jgi:hypothetical protein
MLWLDLVSSLSRLLPSSLCPVSLEKLFIFIAQWHFCFFFTCSLRLFAHPSTGPDNTDRCFRDGKFQTSVSASCITPQSSLSTQNLSHPPPTASVSTHMSSPRQRYTYI